MLKYIIEFDPKADKQLGKLGKTNKPIADKLTKAIYSLTDNPRPHGYKKLTKSSPSRYRIRQGDYRIVYSIHDHIITITVIAVGHRKEIYTEV